MSGSARTVQRPETRLWLRAGPAIRSRFGCSGSDYFAELNALLDRPDEWAYATVTIMRLTRLRDRRRSERSSHAAIAH